MSAIVGLTAYQLGPKSTNRQKIVQEAFAILFEQLSKSDYSVRKCVRSCIERQCHRGGTPKNGFEGCFTDCKGCQIRYCWNHFHSALKNSSKL